MLRKKSYNHCRALHDGCCLIEEIMKERETVLTDLNQQVDQEKNMIDCMINDLREVIYSVSSFSSLLT